jgi:hypothetical protein
MGFDILENRVHNNEEGSDIFMELVEDITIEFCLPNHTYSRSKNDRQLGCITFKKPSNQNHNAERIAEIVGLVSAYYSSKGYITTLHEEGKIILAEKGNEKYKILISRHKNKYHIWIGR